MSILLDALKRSEKQRQLGKVPGIHDPVSDETAQRARGKRWIALTLLAMGAIAVIWFGWQKLHSPQPTQGPAADGALLAVEPAAPDSDAGGADGALPGEQTRAESASGRARTQRSPVATLPPDDTGPTAAVVGSPGEVPGSDPDSEADSEPRKSRVNQSFTAFQAAQQTADAQEKPEAAERQQSSASVKPDDGKTAAPPKQAANQPRPPAAEPRVTEPISFWELPQGIRDDLPDLRIMVLVYAESPQDRFVLVGGQRLVEQDQYQDGVVLEEIRREGAVFLYRNYRFLVKG